MKRVISIILVFLLLISLCITYVFAGDGISEIKDGLKGIGDASSLTDSATGDLINAVIGIMQVAGSGISLIVITMLGIKYILASPSEKADVKKNIMPILIGCILLFAAVNIIGMVESFTNATLPATP